MKSIIVIGHKNPDTDSIVAAIIFADFLKRVRKPILGFSDFKVKPARAGSLNRETEFVFNYFKQKPPDTNIESRDLGYDLNIESNSSNKIKLISKARTINFKKDWQNIFIEYFGYLR